MASEIQVVHSATGATLYAIVRDASGQCWNTAGTPAFEARTVANWADYDVALTETPASSYFYVGTFPATIPAGFYFLDIYDQAGGSPAISDTLAITQSGYWDETAYGQQGTDIRQVAGETASATAEVDFDDLAAVLVGVPTGNPAASFEFEAASATHGSTIANTYANTALDNGTKHTLAPGSADLDAQYTFNVGDGFPSNISFNGYFDAAPPAGTRNVNVYAYNHITSAWDQLSDGATRLNDAGADANRTWTLLSEHRKADGEVKVRLYSTSTDTDDRLYVDQLLVNAVVTLGETTEAIAKAVWDHDIESHGAGDHAKAGFFASRSVMDVGNVVTAVGAVITLDTIRDVAGLYDGCPVQFHDEINDVYEIRRIVTQGAGRVLNLDKTPVSTLTTDWVAFIMPDPISMADVRKISGDEAAADNLEAEYDGTAAAARGIWYVSKAGDDGNDGRSWQTAKLTVGAALAAATAGDTIHVGPGDYAESVDGSAKAGIRLIGSGWGTRITTNADNYTLTLGDYWIVCDAWIENAKAALSGTGIYTSSKIRWRLENLLITATRVAIRTIGCQESRISNCICVGSEYGIRVTGDSSHLIIEKTVAMTDGAWVACSSVGLSIVIAGASASGITLRDCVFAGIVPVGDILHLGQGILAFSDGADSLELVAYNCDFRGQALTGSDAEGILVFGSNTRVTLVGGRAYSLSSGASYDLYSSSGTLVVCNLDYDVAKTFGTITHVPPGAEILADTDELQGNQADWATATGFSTHTSDAVAEAVLKTDVSDVQDTASAHSLTTLVLGATESSMSGTTWTINKTDGTAFATKTVTSDASAKPITGVT